MARSSIEKKEFWQFVLSEQSQSGLSIREFCRREGVSEPSFYQWRKRLNLTESIESSTSGFLPVKVVTSNSPAVESEVTFDGTFAVSSASLQILAPNGFRVEVHPACSAESIHRTLLALDRLGRESGSC